jgi:4-hydroxy-4-methyl-2-oxoglutarate aldolase
MTPTIVRTISRAAAADISRLGSAGVATVHEAQGRSGLLRPYMRPIYAAARVAGSAVTVLCGPGDNLMIHAAIAVVQPGDVLVVATFSESTDGMFGELLAGSCRAHGVAGLVIDAGVRDTAELSAMEFPVWSKAVSAQGTAKTIAGSVNVPIVCAGASISPGDVVIGDADGVVIVPRESAAAVAAAAEARLAKEEATRKRLEAGELGLDIYGLREVLAQRGVTWRD